MVQLTTMRPDARPEDILEVLKRDGGLILENVLSNEQVAAVTREIMPYVEATTPGRDDFTGNLTTRTGALVARSPACRELVLNETIEALCELFLHPNCARHQLHLSQVIRIMPGQKAQAIHRDRWAWGTWLKDIEPQLNTIWAITNFTKENGATQVVPGSTRWPDKQQPTADEIGYAQMKAGSVLVYTGSLFHGGGENASNADRIGINITYTLGWLRQEENQYLSCPPDIAKGLDPKLQALIGYQMGSYALGYYTPPLPPGEGPEVVPPEFALGDKAAGLAGEATLGTSDLRDSLRDGLRSSQAERNGGR